jgi:hypothetical protein
VWGLPVTDDALEDFHWLLQEIRQAGGDALICQATFIAGLADDVATALLAATDSGGPPEPRLPAKTAGASELERYRARVWVTRRGVKADRIGSAWLIKRLIDPEATFKFVSEAEYEPAGGDIRFDMYDAEFTHQGDACTFEVLASAFIPGDQAVAAIGEIIHDIDLKEPRFARPETEGFRLLLLDGVCRDGVEDEERLERGFALFDTLRSALDGHERQRGPEPGMHGPRRPSESPGGNS